MFWALNGATRTPGAGQPSADAGRHDALAGVRRRPAHEQRAPHRADTLPAPIGLPPARVEPAHLDPAAARRHRAPPPRPLVSRNSQPHAGPGQRRTRARRAGSASSAMASTATAKRTARGSAAGHTRRQAPSSAGGEPRGGRRLGVVAGKRLEVGTSRPRDPPRAPRRRGAGRAAARGRPRARRRRGPAPARSPRPAGGPSEPGRGGRAARRCSA